MTTMVPLARMRLVWGLTPDQIEMELVSGRLRPEMVPTDGGASVVMVDAHAVMRWLVHPDTPREVVSLVCAAIDREASPPV